MNIVIYEAHDASHIMTEPKNSINTLNHDHIICIDNLLKM